MLTVKYHKINMNRQIVWCYLFMLTLMEVVKTKVTEQGNSHDGIQDSILDGVSVSYQEFPSANGGGSIVDLTGGTSGGPPEGGGGGSLSFSPPALSFGARPLGAPHSERVVLTNRANRTVHLTSISGNTMHFHSSFFEDKVIPPNGNTSFNVVFLGRERGHVDTSLFIHTSEGIHKYMMSGTSVPSAYRLQPLVGVRLPHNASFSPLIYMHNPHDHPIQITEVYSSGGGVVLELPGGATELPQALWKVPAHATRPVIAVRYRGPRLPPQPTSPSPQHRPQHPHVAYVRIKVNGTQSVLVVAVEVFPSSEPGPYTAPHIVDFGMGGTRDPPKQVRVYMGNSSPRPVRISSVSVRAGTGQSGSGAVRVSPAHSLDLPPVSGPDTHVATLTIDWREAYESGQCCGKVIIRTKQGQHKIVLPYTSHVLSGGLTYDESVTRYLSCETGISILRQFIVKNEYNIGIYLTDIVLGEGIEKYFEIKDFWPKALDPNEAGIGFKIRLKNWNDYLKFESKITLNTNISSLEIPVYIYNGKLDLTLSIPPPPSKKSTLDLGLVGASSTTRATMSLRNANPAPVCLKGHGADLAGAAVQLLGCSPKGLVSTPASPNAAAANITACTCVPTGWSAVYAVSVVAPAREASLRGEIWVGTAHERLVVPVALSSASGGRLSQAEPTSFDHCFPGTLCSRPLRIKSTFPVDMEVVSVEAAPHDSRLYHAAPAGGPWPAVVAAKSLSDIGWLHYDPYLRCDGGCYTGLDLNTTVGQQWLSRVSLPLDTLELDSNLVNTRYSLFLNLTSKSPYHNLSVRLDTNQVRNHMLPTRVSMTWPRLMVSAIPLEAPLAQVWHSSRLQLSLVNPSRSRPLFLQLILDWMLATHHFHKINLPKGLEPPDCPPSRPCSAPADHAFSFSSRGGASCHFPSSAYCERPNSDSNEEDYESMLSCSETTWRAWLPGHIMAHPDSCIVILPPGGQSNITLQFRANHSSRVSSLLYIRNNLTIIEVVRLTGQGVVPSLKFGNRRPGSGSPLVFDLTEKHLKDCDRDRTKKSSAPPNLTVKRTFVARNTGDIPIRVTKFYINSIECEGYGFKVLNCDPFELMPNGTYKVDIAFTPDFTLTKVERTLVLETSLNTAVNYSLVSSIPVSLAGRCAAILRRPPWEPSLRSAALFLLTCIGICVLIAGFYDSDRILKMASVSMSRDRGAVHPPLDLRAIGQMGMAKKTDSWDCCPPSSEKKLQKEMPSFSGRAFHPPVDLKSLGLGSANKKVESWDCCPSPVDKKQPPLKEAPIFKVSPWNYEERSPFGDSGKTSSASQKYEEVTHSVIGKNRKKLGKRNSNASDATSGELAQEQEITPPKEKKQSDKEQNEGRNIWNDVFSRNGIKVLGVKGNAKQSSQGHSSDSSDTVKPPSAEKTNLTQDPTREKHNKLLDVPKKISNLFNGGGNSKTHSSVDTLVTGTSKKHTKTKCHSHQSPNSEEDTSSTTTESSNNDEGDKENDNSTSSSNKSGGSKKSPATAAGKKAKCPVQYKDSYEGDGEDEEYDHKSHNGQSQGADRGEAGQRWTKNRENVSVSVSSKSNSESEKQKLNHEPVKINIVNQSAHESIAAAGKTKKDNFKSNAKKEKQLLSKKRSLDKSFVFSMKNDLTNASIPHSSSGINIPRNSASTPPAVATVWENKASFSDVVARSDNSLFSNNFMTHPKETETRKPDTKPTPAIQALNSSQSTQSSNPSFYSNIDIKKTDTQSKGTTDLGPIGSNYYTKKSPTTWTETRPEKQARQYTNHNAPLPIKKPLPQKMSDELRMINRTNNNSFFLNSNSYFTSSSLSDMAAARNQLSMNEHAPSNNYGSASNNNNNANCAINSMQNIPNTSNMMQQTMRNNHLENSMMMTQNSLEALRDLNVIDPNAYGSMNPNLAVSGNLLDLASNSNLLDLNAANRISTIGDSSQMTGMEAFDSPMPWNNNAGGLGLEMGNSNTLAANSANSSLFDMAYGTMNMYSDNKTGWSAGSNLWDQSAMSRAVMSSANNVMSQDNNSTGPASAIQMQAPSQGNMMQNEGGSGPPEWLMWGGYAGGGPCAGGNSAGGGGCGTAAGSGGLGAIGSAPSRPPPGLAPPHAHSNSHGHAHPHSHAQARPQQLHHSGAHLPQSRQPQTHFIQTQQQPAAQITRAFDPFHSLSSIWSPRSPLEPWANHQNRDADPNREHGNHGHSNQYQ